MKKVFVSPMRFCIGLQRTARFGYVGLGFLLLLSAAPLACGPVLAPAQLAKLQCPVVGAGEVKEPKNCPSSYCPQKPNLRNAVDYKGGKIYFCCGGCIKLFAKSPAKYSCFANHQLVAGGQAVQTSCPLCGQETGTPHIVKVAGINVSFCSAGCKKRAEAVKGKDQVQLVFGDKNFQRSFRVRSIALPATKTSALLIPRFEVPTTANRCCCHESRSATAVAKFRESE